MVARLPSSLQKVLDRLEGVKSNGQGYKALCPAHDDRNNPSLSVGLGEGNKVLLKCFTGCEVEDIVAAIGLRMGDLFEDGIGQGGGGVLYPLENGCNSATLLQKAR